MYVVIMVRGFGECFEYFYQGLSAKKYPGFLADFFSFKSTTFREQFLGN